MEHKGISRYKLSDIQAQMKTVPDMNLTWSAQQGIFACGMTQQEALAVVQALTKGDIDKTMTSNANHKVWQDVYKVVWRELPLYIKFQKAADYFVISFKENTE